jgi:hypothetical protein
MTDIQAVTKALSYDDAKVACPLCGLGRVHTDRRDCVGDLIKVVPVRRLPEVITYLREQLAYAGWTHRR